MQIIAHKEIRKVGVTSFNSICPQDYWLIPFWWNRLNQDGHYRSELAARWVSMRSNKFETTNIIAYIDSVYNVLNTVLNKECATT